MSQFRPTLRQLEVLLAVSRAGGISAAARLLGLSQPAVTRYVREMEDAVGAALLERHPGGVRLTAIGEILRRHAALIAAEVRSTAEEIAVARETLEGRLAIGMSIATPSLVPLAVSAFVARYPRLVFTIVEGRHATITPLVQSGELDMAVLPKLENNPPGDLIEEILVHNRLRVIGRWDHPLARRAHCDASELTEFEWVLPLPDTQTRNELEQAFRARGLTPPSNGIESMSLPVIRELIRNSNRLGVLVDDAVLVEQEANVLRCVDTNLELPLRPVVAMFKETQGKLPYLRRFVQQLKETVRRQSSDGNQTPSAGAS